jgi:hypothetical protein
VKINFTPLESILAAFLEVEPDGLWNNEFFFILTKGTDFDGHQIKQTHIRLFYS